MDLPKDLHVEELGAEEGSARRRRSELWDAYAELASIVESETEAKEWSEGLIGDVEDED